MTSSVTQPTTSGTAASCSDTTIRSRGWFRRVYTSNNNIQQSLVTQSKSLNHSTKILVLGNALIIFHLRTDLKPSSNIVESTHRVQPTANVEDGVLFRQCYTATTRLGITVLTSSD